MKTQKFFILGIALILVILIFVFFAISNKTALFSSESAMNSNYKIGIILPITGYFSDYGTQALNGLALAKEDFQSITILLEDDSGENEKAISAFQKLVTIDNIDAAITFRSGPSSAIAPVTQSSNTILLYSSSVTEPAKSNSNVFVNYLNMYEDCKVLAKELKGKKGSFIGYNFESTQACIRAFEDQGNHIKAEFINPNELQYSTKIKKALMDKPDFLILRGDLKSIELILKEIKQQGFFGFQIICPHSYSAGCQKKETLEKYKDYFKASIGTEQYVGESKELLLFTERYKQKFNEEPGEWSFAVYENIKILSEALNYCKGETECVRNYITTHEFSGLEGKIKFNFERVIEKATNILIFDGNNWIKSN
jgi:ABC-type branched-subunit amino acid transport system substrate-binding protein